MKTLMTALIASASLSFAGTADTVSIKIKVDAIRLAEPIAVDGILSEPVWQNGSGFSQFTQRDPNEGARPTQQTIVHLAYDDEAIYVGARMFDSAPDSIIARLGRRDAQLTADMFGFFIDSYYDRRSGYYFGVNAAGTLYDGVMFNDDWDDNSWDGVWEAKAHIDDKGWTAEMRIPYSQLRFQKKEVYTWGVNFQREIARKNERDYLVFTPKNGSGFVSRFGDLVGIEKINPPRRLEILPYTTTKAEFTQHSPNDPFNDGSKYLPGAGADVKLGLGSNLTLDATVNPDFGQVEVDPAVVNLSDVETFFEEKRPFFIEGASIFNFGRGGARNYWGFNFPNPDFFYTRRIGRAPQGSADGYDYADIPLGTNILGAAKITGKVGGNWNVGALQAITGREQAELQDAAGRRFHQEVEPLTYYGVFRAQKEIHEGRQAIGMISTLTTRRFDDDRLRDQINSSGSAFGVDGWTFLDKSKTWVATGWLGMTQVRGNTARLISLQQNSQHYFQRPDAKHVSVDSSATALIGFAGRFYLNKQKGNSFFNSAFGFVNPKFDINDVGFQWRTDVLNAHVGGGYQWTKPTKWYRHLEFGGAAFRSYDFDGNTIWTGLFHFGFMRLLNYYGFNWNVAYNPQTVNNRRTRGGPLTLNPPGLQFGLSMFSDDRKNVVFNLDAFTYISDGGTSWSAGTGVEWKPAANISVSLNPSLDKNLETAQWVLSAEDALATATFGRRYVFANLDQTTLSASTRLNWTFTPKLSLQLYLQPLISSGNYHDFKELARAKSFAFNKYGEGNSTLAFADGVYDADPDGKGAAPSVQFSNPDFNFKSLRGNAVLRWEYLPGSTLYFVWTQSRSDFENNGEFRFNRSFDRLLSADADNIFLIKASYWLGL